VGTALIEKGVSHEVNRGRMAARLENGGGGGGEDRRVITAVGSQIAGEWLTGRSKVGRMADRREQGRCGNGRRGWWVAMAGW
jgi:hypothetical protein